jgi:hypothetical protein
MSVFKREQAEELRWPSGHTTEELDAVELETLERVRMAQLLRKGISLAPYYRDQLRMRGKSWLGIPRAEQTPGRMARVLILIGRVEDLRNVKAGYTFVAPCRSLIGPCDQEGEHTHRYLLTLI